MGIKKPFSNGVSRTAGLRDRGQQVGAIKSQNGGDHEYVILRQIEADDRNDRLNASVRRLETILSVGLERDVRTSFGGRLPEPTLDDLPAELKAPAQPDRQAFAPATMGLIARLLPGASARQAREVEAGEVRFRAALAQWEQAQARQGAALARLKADAKARNDQVEEQQSALTAGEPDAVRQYAEQVLRDSPYPNPFPEDLKVEFVADSKELFVDLRAPNMEEITPTVERYKFDKSQDKIVGVKKSQRERADLYILIVSQIALRTIHDVFATDVNGQIEAVKLQLYALTTDPSTGKTVRLSLIAARVTRSQLDDVDLARVEPVACLRRLTGGAIGDLDQDRGQSPLDAVIGR